MYVCVYYIDSLWQCFTCYSISNGNYDRVFCSFLSYRPLHCQLQRFSFAEVTPRLNINVPSCSGDINDRFYVGFTSAVTANPLDWEETKLEGVLCTCHIQYIYSVSGNICIYLLPSSISIISSIGSQLQPSHPTQPLSTHLPTVHTYSQPISPACTPCTALRK